MPYEFDDEGGMSFLEGSLLLIAPLIIGLLIGLYLGIRYF
jgi:hypothetical protein